MTQPEAVAPDQWGEELGSSAAPIPTREADRAVVEPTEAEVIAAAAALAVEWYCRPGASDESKAEAATQWKGFASMARTALIAARQQAADSDDKQVGIGPLADETQNNPHPGRGEPVAWRWRYKGTNWYYGDVQPRRCSDYDYPAEVRPLYAAPTTYGWGEREDAAEFELIQDDMQVASVTGPRARAVAEILHYAAMYGQDGAVEVLEIVRTPVDLQALQLGRE